LTIDIEIINLGDFNVYNLKWLTHSPHITSPAGCDATAFAIVDDLSKLISEPTHIPDHSRDKANTLDLFPTSNPDAYSNATLDSPLGNSDHALSHYSINFVPTTIDLPLLKKLSIIAKLTGTLFETFLLLIPGILACLMILPILSPLSLTQFNLDLFIQSSYKPGKSLFQSGSIHNVKML